MELLYPTAAWKWSCSALLIILLVQHHAQALGVNWGTQASHRLLPSIVVRMLTDNNIDKVKLFDADENTLRALAGTDIEVMVAIPNKDLQAMTDAEQAAKWVKRNVERYIFQGGVNIRYVAVGNEPFLVTYNGSFIGSTFPALQNIQNTLNRLNLGDLVKATVPMNADVYTDGGSDIPSHGTFRADVSQQMLQIVHFLHQNNCPFTVNIYPFISLYADASFPRDYAFFDGNSSHILDGTKMYSNVFDASYDTLVSALANAGYPNTNIVVGEIGWPTDGYKDATSANAQRFVQGFLNHVSTNKGTPSRPNTAIEYYLFSLLDEDQKSIAPGNFETHWGIFGYDGMAKYPLTLHPSTANSAAWQLMNATGVTYLQQRWCVLADDASTSDLENPITFACTYSDCTALGYGCSCNPILDLRGNASYAFNQYFQMNSQGSGTCDFQGLGSITYRDPSIGTCRFIVQLSTQSTSLASPGYRISLMVKTILFLMVVLL